MTQAPLGQVDDRENSSQLCVSVDRRRLRHHEQGAVVLVVDGQFSAPLRSTIRPRGGGSRRMLMRFSSASSSYSVALEDLQVVQAGRPAARRTAGPGRCARGTAARRVSRARLVSALLALRRSIASAFRARRRRAAPPVCRHQQPGHQRIQQHRASHWNRLGTGDQQGDQQDAR